MWNSYSPAQSWPSSRSKCVRRTTCWERQLFKYYQIFHQLMKILASLAHPHDVPNLYDVLSSEEDYQDDQWCLKSWFCGSTNNNCEAQIRLESCGGGYSQMIMTWFNFMENSSLEIFCLTFSCVWRKKENQMYGMTFIWGLNYSFNNENTQKKGSRKFSAGCETIIWSA